MIKLSRDLLVSLVAPALVLVLVAAQVAYGLRGFDNPLGGIAAVFEVPGMLVGWGSLGFLLPLLGFLVLDWWGVGASGIALKCLGAAALALALGGVFGVIGGVALGGHLGGALEQLLVETLGTVPSLLLLGLMAVPGAVLTFAGFREIARALDADGSKAKRRETHATAAQGDAGRTTTSRDASPRKAARAQTREADTPGAVATIAGKVRGLFKSTRRVSDLTDLVRTDGMEARVADGSPRRYPTRRYDSDGNELPMDLEGQRDVGTIRFADAPAEAPETTAASEAATQSAPSTPAAGTPTATPSAPALPTIPELFADAQAVMESGAVLEGDAPGSNVLETRPAADAGSAPVDRSLGRVIGLRSEQREEVLPDGVRWADAPPLPKKRKYAESEAADPEDLLAAQTEAVAARFDQVEANPRAAAVEDEALTVADLPPSARDLGEQLSRRSTPAEDEDTSANTASVRDSVLQALGEAQNDSNKRYQEKLAASGIFDFMDANDPSLQTEDEARSSSTAAATGGSASKRKPAKATRAAKKTPAKKAAAKATRSKKAGAKPAAKKKASPGKPTSKKKAAAKKTAPKKAAPKKPAAKKPDPKPSSKKGTSRSGGGSRGGRGRGASPKPATKPAAARVKPPRSTGTTTESPADDSRPWRGGAWHARGALRTRSGRVLDDAQTAALRVARQQPLFRRASDLVVERGAGSPVLLTRRLGLATSQARSLIGEMVRLGVLAEAGARGGHAARFSPATWASLDRA